MTQTSTDDPLRPQAGDRTAPPTPEAPMRRWPVGAEVTSGTGVSFRVWAPRSPTVSVQFFKPDGTRGHRLDLTAEPNGYYSGFAPEAKPGERYLFRLDAGEFPDPASRYQPTGPFGPSEIVAPSFPWTDLAWRGQPRHRHVIYELHLGTFTPEGTWAAAAEQLPELARLGITLIEIMPVAEFFGDFGWGYDGVDLFAPSHLYGTPTDARAFINRAHALGVGVILDVVYNHLGPEGNFIGQFSADYFTTRHTCEWGEAINFDGQNAGPVREFFLTNAQYWIDEFHFDGLRFDATQQMFDASPTHILKEIAAAARAAATERELFLVAENEPQHSAMMRRPEDGGLGLDALWNDDFHHAAIVAATGKADAYYSDYRGTAQEFVSSVTRGFLYQGQWSGWQQQRRGTPAFDLAGWKFVCFLQNHDQVANALRGQRLQELTSPATLRALTGLLLLQPATPMLFQGQEFGASAPFLYFADHSPELRPQVALGRGEFLRQFRTIATEESREVLADPAHAGTFRSSKLDLGERLRHAAVYQLHEDLLRIRREDATIAQPRAVFGSVLTAEAFVVRFIADTGADRLLIVNLGAELYCNPAPEPLLAPCPGAGWRTLWSSESPRYGGEGTPPLETTSNWIIPPRAAVLLEPSPDRTPTHARTSEKH